MAKKNFDNIPGLKIVAEVAKISAEKARVITIKNILNENLVDCSQNQEDITDTADLENSIKELGFTDPLEVTQFRMDDGKYMILSGHRRRAAGVKCGMNMFPCMIKEFESDEVVKNYVLLSNSQRDSEKDPLLFCKRYKMHEEYLRETGFTGKLRKEIAKRLGISIPQADRYSRMNKIILPVWDMVRDEIVGMSSVLPLAALPPDEQENILSIFRDCISEEVDLTRETVKLIVDGYNNGKKTWDAIDMNKPVYSSGGLPINSMIEYDFDKGRDAVSSGENGRNGNSEVNPISAETALDGVALKTRQEEYTGEDNFTDIISSENNDNEPNNGEQSATEAKSLKAGKDIEKSFERLTKLFSNFYEYENAEEAETVLLTMENAIAVTIDEMYNIAKEHNIQDVFKNLIGEVKKRAKRY